MTVTFQRLKIILPHVVLICLSVMYTLLGAAIFYGIERPNEDKLKRASLQRIADFKRQIFLDIDGRAYLANGSAELLLLNLTDERANATAPWLVPRESYALEQLLLGKYVDAKLNKFIEMLHKAFKEHYVSVDDVVRKNDTDVMWTFTSSLFFSATVITAIGESGLNDFFVTLINMIASDSIVYIHSGLYRMRKAANESLI